MYDFKQIEQTLLPNLKPKVFHQKIFMAIIFIIINFHQKNSNVNNLYVHMQSFSVAEFVYPQDPPLPKP